MRPADVGGDRVKEDARDIRKWLSCHECVRRALRTFLQAAVGVAVAAVISAVVFKEKFRLWDIGAILMMFCGVLLTMNVFHLQMSGVNDLFFILSAFFVPLNAFVIQWALHHPKTPVKGMTIGFYNNFYAMLLFGIAVLVSGTGGDLAADGADGAGAVPGRRAFAAGLWPEL